jgi:hypothetical protein
MTKDNKSIFIVSQAPLVFLLLSIITIIYYGYKSKYINYSIIEVNLQDDKFYENYQFWKNSINYYDIDLPPNGRWKNYYFTEFQHHNSIIFHEIETNLYLYSNKIDSLTSIIIHFQKKTNFSQFVAVIELLNKLKINRYNVNGSNIMIYRYARKKFRPVNNPIDNSRFIDIIPGGPPVIDRYWYFIDWSKVFKKS